MKEKSKKTPNFEFRPLDKESLLDSIAETTREGQTLAQNIPPTKTVNVSKLSQPLEKKQIFHLAKENKLSIFLLTFKKTSFVFNIKFNCSFLFIQKV